MLFVCDKYQSLCIWFLIAIQNRLLIPPGQRHKPDSTYWTLTRTRAWRSLHRIQSRTHSIHLSFVAVSYSGLFHFPTLGKREGRERKIRGERNGWKRREHSAFVQIFDHGRQEKKKKCLLRYLFSIYIQIDLCLFVD